MIYKWKEGFRHPKLSAQDVGERIENLRETKGGFVKPEDVLEDARSPESPLHVAFEWDNSIAAEAYRREQARKLIQNVTVKIEMGDKVQTYRAFVSISGKDENNYTGTVSAMSDEEMRKQILMKAWNDLQNWRKKYADLKELAEIVSTIDQLENLFAKAA